MNNKKAKALRKSTQYETRQITEVFNLVMDRQLTQPLKLRWRTALRILVGESKDKILLITFFILSQCAAIGLSFLFYFYFVG